MSDTYVINGVEITYDTFDIDNMDRWELSVKHVSDETKMSIPGETPLQKLRRICNTILDFLMLYVETGRPKKYLETKSMSRRSIRHTTTLWAK